MYKLPERVKKLTPYIPQTVPDGAIRLDANESFLPPSEELMKAVSAAVAELPLNRYPDPSCTRLRSLAAKRYGVDAENITVGNGSDELISLIMNTLVEPKGRVMVFSPDFSMYKLYASLAGLNVLSYPRDPGSEIYAAPAARYIREKDVSCVIFSNPCNPSSNAASRAKVLEIVAAGALTIIDEAYMDFWREEGSVKDCIEAHSNLIVLRTCSKAFGLAGARLGFALAGSRLTRALQAVRSPYNVSSLDQAAGEALLSRPVALDAAREMIIASAQSLHAALSALAEKKEGLTVYPTRTNFVCFALPEPDVAAEKLCDRGIYIRNLGRLLRVTAGSESENAAFVKALEEIL